MNRITKIQNILMHEKKLIMQTMDDYQDTLLSLPPKGTLVVKNRKYYLSHYSSKTQNSTAIYVGDKQAALVMQKKVDMRRKIESELKQLKKELKALERALEPIQRYTSKTIDGGAPPPPKNKTNVRLEIR